MQPDRTHSAPEQNGASQDQNGGPPPNQQDAAALPASNAADQLAAADARAEDFHQKYLYALAEVENTRKRMQRQTEDAAHNLRDRLLLKFLPVLDNLERSLAHLESQGLRQGLEAIVRGFENALESEGVTPISATGQRFDPRVAEAIGTQKAEGVENDTVVAEAQRGYRLGDRILRPAKVIVAKND
ncbi:MAG: nucleotide exchange factor GrpE [Vulcanimicrobiaceae bacterium]